MDDKEKEKFGVVIEKDKQPEGDQSKVEEKTLESENLSPKTENNDFSEKKQPENESKPDESNQEVVTEENNENKPDESKQETVSQENETVIEENNNNNNDEEKKDHEVIHKKDGRLHIYVRQDKYKGELKSKNWVGRLYIDGKQKISSSGTPNLEDAIPILEKWFDDVHAQKEKEKEQKNLEQTTTAQETSPPQQTTATEVETVSPTEVVQQNVAPIKEATVESQKTITQKKETNIVLCIISNYNDYWY